MDWLDMHIFLYGEKGSGKKLYAKMLHQESSNMHGTSFVDEVVIDSDSDPDLTKRAIFGYFDDDRFHPGCIEKAKHGTVYLHDIDQLPEETLRELIKSIHEKAYFPVDSKKIKQNNARFILSTDRIVANTNKLSIGDSFLKINMRFLNMADYEPDDDFNVEWNEPDDYDLVLKLIVSKICRENGIELIDISIEAFDILIDYDWPGNFSETFDEMENAINKKISRKKLLDSPLLEPDCLSEKILRASKLKYAKLYLERPARWKRGKI